MLFRQAEQKNKIAQTCPPGVDPKSVLCLNFKAGRCVYGDKCRFSHDPNVERKDAKRDIYSDSRDALPPGESEDMTEWDEQKLAEVVAKKAAKATAANPTAGICNHFLQAVEGRKYGWFWECPNGEKCQYRHALPAGFVLKRDQKKEEKETEKQIEDIVEEERQALKGEGGTPMTLENFNKWKLKYKSKRAKDKKEDPRPVGKTGRQLLEESGDKYNEDDGNGPQDNVDLSQYLKSKREEEDKMDQENAAFVEQLQKDMAEAEKEAEKRVEAEVKAQIEMAKQQQAENLANGTTTTTTSSSTTTTTTTTQPTSATTLTTETTSTATTASTTQLSGVDTALFAEEELPEFDDN